MINIVCDKSRQYNDLQVGEKIFLDSKGYEISNIKNGGMGRILLCRETETSSSNGILPQFIAIKGIKKTYFNTARAQKSFKKELICWSQVNVPHMVQLVGIGCFQGKGEEYVAITERYDGSLRDLISGNEVITFSDPNFIAPLSCEKEYSRFKLSDKLSILYQISKALFQILSSERIFHLDLKPENVLFKGAKRIYSPCKDGYFFHEYTFDIADLGLSMFKDDLRISCLKKTNRQLSIAETIEIFGTPNYMSPERFTKGYMPNEYADVYALGAIFFELITGCPYIIKQEDAENAGIKYLEKRWLSQKYSIESMYGRTDAKTIKGILNITLSELPERFELSHLITVLESEFMPVNEVIFTEFGDNGYTVCLDSGKVLRGLPHKNPNIQYSDGHHYDQFDLNSIIEEKTRMSFRDPHVQDRLNRIKREIVSDVERQVNNTIGIGSLASGSFLSSINYEYDLKVCIQYGLLECLKKAMVKASSLINRPIYGFPEKKERFGRSDLFRQECIKIHQYLYRIAPSKHCDFYGNYIEKVFPEILQKGVFEKEYHDYTQNKNIYINFRCVQSMIVSFAAGNTTNLEYQFGKWCKYMECISLIAPGDEDNSVSFYSIIGAYNGIIFKRINQKKYLIKKIYIKEVLKSRYIITAKIENYDLNEKNDRYQLTHQDEEKTEVLLGASTNLQSFLDPSIFSTSKNEPLRKSADWIYS
jgi:serine/threonine protein kinase